ncbi:MAG: glycine--tRNA ligase subunit beta [Alphaproteobacteria bacterium]|jgi:glycyl-tRNA synthetase beta chain|nr:glycine--tRNA ligase subunit beta [Alphaproteobacteria bacterium]
MSQFLLEILTEEIPSTMQVQAQEDIQTLFITELNKLEISFTSIKSYSTPRRLVVHLDGLAKTIDDKFEEKKGPRVDASAEVITGFLKTYSLKLEDCEKRITPKGEFYFYQQVVKGGEVKDIFVSLIQNILTKMKFKKSMVWNSSKVAWARPIRGLLAMFDESLLNFSFAEISSSNTTTGHRFLGSKEIVVKSIENYFIELENNHVILDSQKRKQIILDELQEIVKTNNLIYIKNESLLQEITYLVEYPCIYVAEIPQKYMILPKELMVEIIVKNQRYINFINRDGSLSNKYAIVSNLDSQDKGATIINGNNKVLQARLEDGLFFYNNDLKTTLVEKSQKLKNINFFEGLGSIYYKTQRVAKLFKDIFQEDQNFLCEIYKADLTSETVVEIPELQGIMGYYYAVHEDTNKELALAIKNQYKPQGAGDSLPENLLGAKLALLDKLDTLISFFSIGKKPSGSKDPFALRRAAIGIIRIIEEFKIDIDISPFISSELKTFLQERIEVYLANTYDSSIVKNINVVGLNIFRIIEDVKNLDDLLKSNSGVKVIALYKRASNILKSLHENKGTIDTNLLVEPEEKNLYDSYLKILPLVNSFVKENKIKESLEALAELHYTVDNFLDSVQINVKQDDLKNNRINILLATTHLCDSVLNLKNMNL